MRFITSPVIEPKVFVSFDTGGGGCHGCGFEMWVTRLAVLKSCGLVEY